MISQIHPAGQNDSKSPPLRTVSKNPVAERAICKILDAKNDSQNPRREERPIHAKDFENYTNHTSLSRHTLPTNTQVRLRTPGRTKKNIQKSIKNCSQSRKSFEEPLALPNDTSICTFGCMIAPSKDTYICTFLREIKT